MTKRQKPPGVVKIAAGTFTGLLGCALAPIVGVVLLLVVLYVLGSR